jgi:translation initiation factor 1
MADDKKRIVPSTTPLGTSLADALAARGVPVSQPTPAASPTSATPPAPGDIDLSRATKVVLRRERKGRGGKTATVIEGLSLRPRHLDRAARDLKRALGCGATVEDDTIVLQGDLAARVTPWLTARGAKKVVVGN